MNDGLYGNSIKLNSGLIGVLLYQRIEYFMHIQKVMHYQFLNYFVGVLQCCATLMLQIHGNSTKSIKLYKTLKKSITFQEFLSFKIIIESLNVDFQ